MIPLNLDAIITYLKEQGFHAQLQTETDQGIVIFKIGDKEFPLFIRIFDGNELLQLLTFLPCTVKKSAFADTARLLHLLNKELDTPGFCLDEDSSLVFYRCMIPIENQQINTSLLLAYLNSTQLVCKSFSPVIAVVAFNTMSFDEMLKKIREQHKNPSFAQSLLKPE